MTLQELQDKANTKLAQIWGVIQNKEDAYFTKHGQYFGLRWSPSTPVIDGVDTPLELDFPSRGIVTADVSFPATDITFQLVIERINQQAPLNTAIWDFIGEPPAPVWGGTGETYRVGVRVELPSGEVWMRNRTRDNEDSGWFKFEPKI